MKPVSRVLLLGGTGFLGKVAARHLAPSFEVRSLGSRDADLTHPESLRPYESLLGPETALLYASAITREKGDDDRTYDANMTMARNVASFLCDHPCRIAVYLSSVSVYGRRTTDLAINEGTPVDLDSNYARAKFDGETVFRDAGIPLSVLRVCHVYGPGDTHLTYGPMKFLKGIRDEGIVTLYGEGEERREHLFSEDFGRLLAPFCRGDQPGITNLAPGIGQTFAQMVDVLRRAVATPFQVRKLPRAVPLTHQGFDISRLRQACPDFAFTPLLEGLARTWEGGFRP